MNRIADLTLNGKPYSEWPEYIHVGTNGYVAGFFSQLPAMSHGLVKIGPRDKDGKPLAAPERPDVPVEAVLFADSLRK